MGFRVPMGPQTMETPHIIDETSTTDETFVTLCGVEYERTRRCRATEVESIDELSADGLCETCANEL